MRDAISFFGHYRFKNGKHSKNRICLSTLTLQSPSNIQFDPCDWGDYGMIFSPISHSNQVTYEKSIKQLSSFIQNLAPIENLNIIQLFQSEIKPTQIDIDDYAIAARCAYEAGFDGAEIQSSANVMINQAEIARDILKACRYVVPKEFLLGFRILPENQQTGIDLDDNLQIAELLSQDGADFITLSLSNVLLPSTKYLHLSNKPILAYFRERLGNHYPLLVAGNVEVPSDAQKALESGASFVALNM